MQSKQKYITIMCFLMSFRVASKIYFIFLKGHCVVLEKKLKLGNTLFAILMR